ncbi:MAG TPA: glycine--tRNA ligase [Candidatus Binataceae bacterium]|nr:glycine--tRNA ligase [Candidatus Binataceae bacterium]
MSAENAPEAQAAPAIRAVTMEKLVNLCKRRGLVFPASTIYGGLGSTFDYGPLGIELKRNVKEAWWREMVQTREDVIGLDSAILQHPRTWEASGHLQNFTDPLVDCKACKHRFRADHISGDRCPDCGGELTEARQFNLMFKTFMGPVEDSASVVYLRPETAQGIFANFANILDTQRVKLPFGIAQTGKSFRNEITPGNFIFRTCEFEQMEMEYFIKPEAGEEARCFDYWVNERFNWYVKYGIEPGHLRLRPHAQDELSHYSRGTTDIEFLYPFGWGELEGIAKRGSFDLDQHAKFSGKDLTYFDEDAKTRYRPWVIEPAAGVDRTMLAFMLDAYDEDVVENEERIVLRLDPRLAPVKVAVYPLLRKGGQPEKAHKVRELLQRYFNAAYDQAGSIGRRYRRQDEIGTPFGVTIDHQTMEDDTVTLRDRDTTTQDRMPIDALVPALIERIGWYR